MDWFGLKTFLIAAAIFVPLERLLSLRRDQKLLRRQFGTDLFYFLVSSALIKLGLAAIILAASVASATLMPSAIRDVVAGQPGWLQFLEVLLVADMGFYVMHRAFHAIPWLWNFHAIHHSIEELDWLAGARVHPVDQILTKGASIVPIVALGFSDGAVAAFALLYQWQSIFIHSNLRIKFGPLRWLLASPEFHHWHHSRDVEARDRNFAGQLPFIDLAFGTHHMPKGKMPAAYGVDGPMPRRYLPQLLYPLMRDRALKMDNEARDE